MRKLSATPAELPKVLKIKEKKHFAAEEANSNYLSFGKESRWHIYEYRILAMWSFGYPGFCNLVVFIL